MRISDWSSDVCSSDLYAIRHADYVAGKSLPVQQRCYAGVKPEALLPDNTVRLFTGSLLPEGADTVVMQEDVDESDNTLLIHRVPKQGAHIRYRGEDIQTGEQLFAKGQLDRTSVV